MIILLALMALALYLVITKTQFFKKRTSNNKFMTQLGMALLVGTMTINILFVSDIGTALKYTVVGMGTMSFIAILIEMVITKKKQTTS